MSFCTAINCMDGRVQLPVIKYLQDHFDAEYVDAVTEPGPNRILAHRKNPELTDSILARVNISVEQHGSVGIAVVGHHDCAGNPAAREEQSRHVREAIRFLREHYAQAEIIGLWVNAHWAVEKITGG